MSRYRCKTVPARFMEKVVDFSKNVDELCKENAEIVDIMKEMGFVDIAGQGMLNTVGRFMTIPKGAAMKGIPMAIIKDAFRSRGFQIQNGEE